MMLPFINAFFIYLVLHKENFFANRMYNVFLDKHGGRMPRLLKQLLECDFCLGFWLALIEGLAAGHSFGFIIANAVATKILINLL